MKELKDKINGIEFYKKAEKKIKEGRYEKYIAIRDLILEGYSFSWIARQVKVSPQAISFYYSKYTKNKKK